MSAASILDTRLHIAYTQTPLLPPPGPVVISPPRRPFCFENRKPSRKQQGIHVGTLALSKDVPLGRGIQKDRG